MASASKFLFRIAPIAVAGALAPFVWNARKPERLDGLTAIQAFQRERALGPGLSATIWNSTDDLPTKLLNFVDASPSPYHAVDNARTLLQSQGFTELEEGKAWAVTRGGKYYVVRTNTSGSSLTAFAVGKQWVPGNSFSIVATHVDSPCLKLKPVSKRLGFGYEQVAVSLYGGGLWHTWFDRDLGIAGRVLVRTGDEEIETRLINIREPLLHIPTLAVHYAKQNPFEFNLQNVLTPLLASRMATNQMTPRSDDNATNDHVLPGRSNNVWPAPAAARHHKVLVDRIASEIGVAPGLVLDFDLSLFDVQPSALGGIHREFVYASRLDNLMMTFCGLTAFTRSVADPSALDNEQAVRVITLFDHEEIGSRSTIGALSPFLPHILERISNGTANAPKDAHMRAMSKSFLLSADMTHGFHPLHPNWHDPQHSVQMNKGLVVSSHPRNAFMTNTPGTVLLREIASRASDLTENGEVPLLQLFTTPNTVSCGSTLGPLLGTQTGIRTLDVGNSQLSMHSTREMAGKWDIANAVAILQGFYRDFVKVDEGIVLK